VLHVEFQRYREEDMPRRVWKYNASVNIITGKPVYSVVIYLVTEPSITEPVYKTSFRNGHVVQWFSFDQIKLWELSPEVFEEPQLTGLLPLLPLTKNGQNRETVERMIREMRLAGKQNLLWLGKAVAGLVLKSSEDNQWLKERFQVMFDILKESWVYQETIEEGRKEGIEKGIKEGMEKGLEKGMEKGLEQSLIQFIEIRFPTLLTLAKQAMEQKLSPDQLQTMLTTLYQANTIDDARTALQK
jgi:predicted transposase YdaD